MSVTLEGEIYGDGGPALFARKLEPLLALEEDAVLAVVYGSDSEKAMVQRLGGFDYCAGGKSFAETNELLLWTGRRAERVVYQSKLAEKIHASSGGRSGVVIHNPSDLLPSETKSDKLWAASASWRKNKRPEETIGAFLRLAPPDATLLLLGEGGESGERVVALGRVTPDEESKILARAGTFVSLGFNDACSNSAAKACALGLRVVCVEHSGAAELPGEKLVVPEGRVSEPSWRDYDSTIQDLVVPPLLWEQARRSCVPGRVKTYQQVAQLYLAELKEAHDQRLRTRALSR